MVRIHAQGIVSSGAVVKNLYTLRDGSMMYFPRNPMRKSLSGMGRTNGSVPSIPSLGACPNPAGFPFLDLIKKSNSQRSALGGSPTRNATKKPTTILDFAAIDHKWSFATLAEAINSAFGRDSRPGPVGH